VESVETATRAVFCRTLTDKDKENIVYHLAELNACDSRSQIKPVSSSDGDEAYRVQCLTGKMEFHCRYPMNKACFATKYDIPAVFVNEVVAFTDHAALRSCVFSA
jgi:hypothetical protein